MADKIRRQMQEITLGIEDEAINLPTALCEEALNETRFSLIVKPVNPRKQNLRAMLSALPRLWGVSEEVNGRILENRKIQFLFQSDESMSSVLGRGPWSFNDWMCVIQKWNPQQNDEDLKRIPFWVQIRGIPLHFLTLCMITFIGESLGVFIETDFGGDGAVLVDYVRVKLLWHIDSPLRFQRQFQFGNASCVLKFRYEKLRNFCSICGMLTQEVSECPLGNNPLPPPPAGEDDDDNDPDFNPDDNDAHAPEARPEATNVQGNKEEKEEESQSSSKKRKTEPPTLHDNITTTPLIYCETRQGYATEDTHQCYSKRNRRESEILETRNWFMLATSTPAQASNNNGRGTPTTPNTDRDGTVGQKPPEQR